MAKREVVWKPNEKKAKEEHGNGSGCVYMYHHLRVNVHAASAVRALREKRIPFEKRDDVVKKSQERGRADVL